VLGNLAGVNKSYRQNLSGSKTATAQANALDGYSGAVKKVVDRFRGLAPPPALRPWQRAQILRLQQIVDTGHTLATALRVRDRNGTAALIKRFRFLLRTSRTSRRHSTTRSRHTTTDWSGSRSSRERSPGSINAFRISSARTG
jgi:hypothetical protein